MPDREKCAMVAHHPRHSSSGPLPAFVQLWALHCVSRPRFRTPALSSSIMSWMQTSPCPAARGQYPPDSKEGDIES